MTITEFITSMPEELTSFFEETDAFLTGKGYRCEIKEAKSGPLVSYKKDKKTLLNYVCRKTGVKIRLYAANIGRYEHFLDTLPDKMKNEILYHDSSYLSGYNSFTFFYSLKYRD